MWDECVASLLQIGKLSCPCCAFAACRQSGMSNHHPRQAHWRTCRQGVWGKSVLVNLNGPFACFVLLAKPRGRKSLNRLDALLWASPISYCFSFCLNEHRTLSSIHELYLLHLVSRVVQLVWSSCWLNSTDDQVQERYNCQGQNDQDMFAKCTTQHNLELFETLLKLQLVVWVTQ